MTCQKSRETMFFAPAVRAPRRDIEADAEALALHLDPNVRAMLDTLSEMVGILNEGRQFIFANRSLQTFLGLESSEAILGARFGEVLGCVNAEEGPGGCGTSEACGACGVQVATLGAQHGRGDRRECRLIRVSDRAADFMMHTTPLNFGGRQLIFCAVTDVSGEKRREALERTFFHDVLNTASAVTGFARLSTMVEGEQSRVMAIKAHAAAERLTEEIRSQRDLLSAEQNALEVTPSPQESLAVLRGLVDTWSEHGVAHRRQLLLDPAAESVLFETDVVLLRRVLSNMIKNALEASEIGATVKVSCHRHDDALEFLVHNPGCIPRTSQLQIFKRSFSTRGRGRGLGTYSMKMLSERYLHGKVSFTSNARSGTTFRARYPLRMPPA